MSVPLEKLMTEAALAKLAGKRSFERGVAYFEDGAVLSLIQAGSTAKARVLGAPRNRHQRFVARVVMEVSKAGGTRLRSSKRPTVSGRGHVVARLGIGLAATSMRLLPATSTV